MIGGGVSEAGDLLLKPARAAFEPALTGRGHRPFAEIRIAQLGNDAGIVGAADLAREAVSPLASGRSVSPLASGASVVPARLRAPLDPPPSLSLVRRPSVQSAAAPFGSRDLGSRGP